MAGTSEQVDEAEIARFLSAWFAVRQFIQAANFNHFHQAGLSATQFMVLNVLPANDETMTIGELAKRMNLKAATVAKTVDSLESREMLKRVRSREDRRVVLVRITRRGQQLQNAAIGQFRRQIDNAFRGMSARDRVALIKGLESFVIALKPETVRSASSLTREKSGAPPGKRSSPRSRQP